MFFSPKKLINYMKGEMPIPTVDIQVVSKLPEFLQISENFKRDYEHYVRRERKIPSPYVYDDIKPNEVPLMYNILKNIDDFWYDRPELYLLNGINSLEIWLTENIDTEENEIKINEYILLYNFYFEIRDSLLYI